MFCKSLSRNITCLLECTAHNVFLSAGSWIHIFFSPYTTERSKTTNSRCSISHQPSLTAWTQIFCASLSSDGQQDSGVSPGRSQPVHSRHLHPHRPHEGTQLWQVSVPTLLWLQPRCKKKSVYCTHFIHNIQVPRPSWGQIHIDKNTVLYSTVYM